MPTGSGLLNLDCSVMPVSVYTTDHKAETIGRVVEAVKEFSDANPDERITFRLASGNVGVMAATNEEVEASQFPILAYVYAAVIALCLLSFRSVAATVCIIVPLAVVSLLAYALMALLEIGLKVSTLPVVALGVEIGVDYGIYIYGRLRTHLAQGLDFAAAYERTLATTGAGVVLTGLTLAAGVATWIVAPLKFQADMGTVHGADVHVPGQHGGGGGAAAGARSVAGPAGEGQVVLAVISVVRRHWLGPGPMGHGRGSGPTMFHAGGRPRPHGCLARDAVRLRRRHFGRTRLAGENRKSIPALTTDGRDVRPGWAARLWPRRPESAPTPRVR